MSTTPFHHWLKILRDQFDVRSSSYKLISIRIRNVKLSLITECYCLICRTPLFYLCMTWHSQMNKRLLSCYSTIMNRMQYTSQNLNRDIFSYKVDKLYFSPLKYSNLIFYVLIFRSFSKNIINIIILLLYKVILKNEIMPIFSWLVI